MLRTLAESGAGGKDMSEAPYYYSCMSRPMQEAYHALAVGMRDIQSAIRIPRLYR